MKKLEGVKNHDSLLLFVAKHLSNFKILNCRGLQEKDHGRLVERRGIERGRE